MTRKGLELLKAHGFRPVGPFVADVGRWSEVTLLFRFDSLAERERLIARFSEHADAKTYGTRIGELTEDVVTRLLVPAPFSLPQVPAHAGDPEDLVLGDLSAPAPSGRDRSRGPRGRLFRPLRLGELRLGRSGRRDAPDRPASRHPRVRIPLTGQCLDRQARADARADAGPRGRRTRSSRRCLNTGSRESSFRPERGRCCKACPGRWIRRSSRPSPGKPRSAVQATASNSCRWTTSPARVARRSTFGPGRPLRGADGRPRSARPAGRQRHGAVGRDLEAARNPRGEARGPGGRLVGRARPGRLASAAF